MKLIIASLIGFSIIGGGMVLTRTGLIAGFLKNTTLTQHLEMGVSELNVKNVEQSKYFYADLVGLEILDESPNAVTLGHQGQPIIRLVATPSLDPGRSGSAGLYHNAIVFSSQAVLAQTLDRILQNQPERFSGSSDHRVSEAFYFTDPEGNGVELYFDKDPAKWQWQDGRIVMGSSYIDPQTYIDTYSIISGNPNKKMGHVHLKVGNVDEAKNFYVEMLGLVITAETPGALFVSDGKYHHHLGLNTWESAGAGKRTESLGLKRLTLRLASITELKQLKKRLDRQNISYQETETGMMISDPWENKILIENR